MQTSGCDPLALWHQRAWQMMGVFKVLTYCELEASLEVLRR